jgi:hypothetical protein
MRVPFLLLMRCCASLFLRMDALLRVRIEIEMKVFNPKNNH